MPYIGTKVYSDGGHYIAIPPENFPSKQRKRKKPKPTEINLGGFWFAFGARA
ncbi:MAG: hypothetical protein K2N57_06105 [Clostridia bacterium]|nr:hypothetical protein [Clostridia bacterium]